MEHERRSSGDTFLLMAIQNPKRFMELAEIACSDMGPEAVQDVGQSYYEEFIGLNTSHISFLMEATLNTFKELLGNASVAGLLNTDKKIFDFFRLFLGMFSSGMLALSPEHQLVFLKAVGDRPDGPTQKRIDAKIEECRPMLIELYHDFITCLNTQPLPEDQRRRLAVLQEKCEKHNIEGIFLDDATMTSQEMAVFLWQRGYIAFPTVESMIEYLERYIQDTINGTTTPGAQYVFKWEMSFHLFDPKGVPVPSSHINELEEVIEQWVAKKNLQLEDIYIGNFNELEAAKEDGVEDD